MLETIKNKTDAATKERISSIAKLEALDLHEKVRLIAERLGIKQFVLANYLGISDSDMSKKNKGRLEYTPEEKQKLEQLFGCKL